MYSIYIFSIKDTAYCNLDFALNKCKIFLALIILLNCSVMAMIVPIWYLIAESWSSKHILSFSLLQSKVHFAFITNDRKFLSPNLPWGLNYVVASTVLSFSKEGTTLVWVLSSFIHILPIDSLGWYGSWETAPG